MKVSKIIMNACRLIFIVNGIWILFLGQWGKGLGLLGSLILTFLPEAYRWLTKKKVPGKASMWYVIFILGCQWLGTYLRLYDSLFWWDILLHFSSGFLLGYIGLVCLMSLDSDYSLFKNKKYMIITLFIFTFSVTGAAIWEMCEFLADQILSSFTQLGSLKDTMEDIVCGIVSAFLFASYTYIRLKREKPSSVTSYIRLNHTKENVKE